MYADDLDKLNDWEVSKFAAKNIVAGTVFLHLITLLEIEISCFAIFVTLDNIIVTGSSISHDSLKQLVDTLFSTVPAGPTSVQKSTYIGGDVRVRKDISGLSYVGIAFPIGSGTVNN